MNPNQADFIRKTKVKYLNCKQGGDHQGEVLNFICIDSTCKKKGLICPVCQATYHSEHQALHLKIFLSEIHKNLLNNDSSQKQFLSVSQQLRKLQSSKKQMQKVLRQIVMQISQKVKQTEQKINHSYLTLRKIILSQSTVSSKIPQLYQLLSGEGQNQEFIINQLKKFSQFLQYKNNKIHVIDNAQKLIDQYQKTASSISIHLLTILPQVSKKLQSLPFIIKTISKIKEYKQQKQVLKFSSLHKSQSIALQQDGKLIEVIGQAYGGLAFVECSQNNSQVKKISLRIKKSVSDAILLGIGNPQNYISKNYIIDQANCSDLTAITALGFPLNDFDTSSFVFGQGDTIDIEWNIQESKLTFSRRNGIQKFQVSPQLNSDTMKSVFFVCLGCVGDIVQIVQ